MIKLKSIENTAVAILIAVVMCAAIPVLAGITVVSAILDSFKRNG
jgi:hypothetical protein